MAIVRDHLMERALEDHGLKADQVSLSEEALEVIIDHYTREAGVRNLSRQLASVLRSVAHDLAFEKVKAPVEVTPARVKTALGPQKVFQEAAEPMDTPGVSIGLAWTPVGGEILFIETAMMRGPAKLTLTGQLGEVMKESAHTALSLVRARADALNIAPELFSERSLHLHLPSGAIPKDGPSAGVAITVALTSLLLGKPMRDRVAMTGEISLRGRVLPVGGIKEKVLAAARAGMKEVILPQKNAGDLEEIPEHLLSELTFHLIDRVEEALKLCLDVELPSSPALAQPQAEGAEGEGAEGEGEGAQLS
jgi:ATP-dependent Lon protease